MDFSSALVALRLGIPMRRACFQDERAVFLVPAGDPLQEHFQFRSTGNERPVAYIWVPSIHDILATDWERLPAATTKPPAQRASIPGFDAHRAMGEP